MSESFASQDRPGSCMRLRAGKQSPFSVGEGDVFDFKHGMWSRII